MAEFTFYGTWSDSWDILEELTHACAIRLLPDIWYSSPRLHGATELSRKLRGEITLKRGVFILPEGARVYRRAFNRMKDGPKKGMYSILPRLLPGSVDLELPACFIREGTTCLSHGSLFIPPEYDDPEEGGWRKPTEAEKEFYNELKNRLKKRMKRQRPRNRSIWVAEEATAMLAAGTAQIVDKGI